MNTTTVQYEVVFVQKDAYIGDKHSKRVNAEGEEHCHHCWNKYVQWIDDYPDLSPKKREHIKKDCA